MQIKTKTKKEKEKAWVCIVALKKTQLCLQKVESKTKYQRKVSQAMTRFDNSTKYIKCGLDSKQVKPVYK